MIPKISFDHIVVLLNLIYIDDHDISLDLDFHVRTNHKLLNKKKKEENVYINDDH